MEYYYLTCLLDEDSTDAFNEIDVDDLLEFAPAPEAALHAIGSTARGMSPGDEALPERLLVR